MTDALNPAQYIWPAGSLSWLANRRTACFVARASRMCVRRWYVSFR